MRLLRVALIIDRQVGYRQAVLRGIWRYAEETGHWVCQGCDLIEDQVRALPMWEPDGVIGGFWHSGVAREVLSWKIPTVDVFDWYPELACPRFSFDDAMIGQLGAEHLIERGLRQFGFVGELNLGWARRRMDGFAAHLNRQGYRQPLPHALAGGATAWGYWGQDPDASLRKWLTTLPTPIGLMCANDDTGFRVLETCRQLEIRVPEDVAVVGVDNDDFLCSLAHPALSSIDTRPERIGYEAARLLDRMMRGEKVEPGRRLLDPVEVVARQSTDVLSISDTDLVDAVRFIRRNATRRITVKDVLEVVPMRRRTLERRFRAVLGHGVLAEVRAARLNKARELLAGSDLSIASIARRCGFGNTERFSRVFREESRTTPTAYRRQFRPRE